SVVFTKAHPPMRLCSFRLIALSGRAAVVTGGCMLQNIRDNSQGWIAKTIIGLIIVLLALTGFEAIFNSAGKQQTAAEVNGEEITLAELNQAIELQRRQLLQQFGRDFDTSLIEDRKSTRLNPVT